MPPQRVPAGDGDNTPEQPHPTASIQGAKAFTDPAMLAEFVNFVRQKGEELKASAVISVVPKSKVAFPQVCRVQGTNHGRLWLRASMQNAC
jgi:hypothetical protein